MSGMAGIVDKRGEQVDSRLLRQMGESLAFRGPDGAARRTLGRIGLVHSLLVTGGRAPSTRQPLSLDGRVWICADARIDGQAALKARLSENGAAGFEQSTDAELILHAYRKWGRRCLDYLIGDFSFAVWDGLRNRLFCARDHFGVKPFFYADTPRHLLFANTLNCLRRHPQVTRDLDDRAIADFLIYGMLAHLDRSAFAGISRLPPAHALTWSAQTGLAVRRYWRLPLPALMRYRSEQDYIDRFDELLQQAVDDRLRTNRAVVSMSGGLDSTSVAAAAARSAAYRNGDLALHAACAYHGRLFHDDEHRYARRAARKLVISFQDWQVDAVAGEPWFGNWSAAPEPIGRMVPLNAYRRTEGMAKRFRVALTGQGGDPALHPGPSSFPFFLAKLFTGSLGLRLLAYMRRNGHFPRLDIRKSLRHWIGGRRRPPSCVVPPWLKKSFLSRLETDPCRPGGSDAPPAGSLRGGAYRQLVHCMWPNLFESQDSGCTGMPVEVRHPYFDLRLIGYLLALPPVPWCVDKHLIRSAMRNRLPDVLLQRPKTNLRGFPEYERLREDTALFQRGSVVNGRLESYIDADRYRSLLAAPEKLRPQEYGWITRPMYLAQWMNRLDSQ